MTRPLLVYEECSSLTQLWVSGWTNVLPKGGTRKTQVFVSKI